MPHSRKISFILLFFYHHPRLWAFFLSLHDSSCAFNIQNLLIFVWGFLLFIRNFGVSIKITTNENVLNQKKRRERRVLTSETWSISVLTKTIVFWIIILRSSSLRWEISLVKKNGYFIVSHLRLPFSSFFQAFTKLHPYSIIDQRKEMSFK